MYLPTFPRRMAAVRHVQTDFRGYDHRPSCPEGGIYEMTNGSAADSPLFSTRPGRTRIYPCSGTPNGLFAAGDGLLWCAGTALYYNGKAVPGCTLTDTPKVFAALGGTVLIWPDKVWFRPADGTFGSAEPSWSGSVTLAGADTDGDGRASILVADGAGAHFRTGDAVTLSGFGDVRNNGTYILRGIDGARLRFDPDTFVRAGAVNGVTITRRVPDAQHACSYGNRLWACAQIVMILYNLSGDTTDYSKYYVPFTDVRPSTWYYNAVAWGYDKDIVAGMSTTTFAPDGLITREQMAVLLYGYTEKYAPAYLGGAASLNSFPDAASVSNWAYAAMSWAVGNGLISGIASNGADYLAPSGGATRAQIAAIMMRYCRLTGL